MAQSEFFLRKKRARAVLWTEAGVLLVAVVVIIFLLNFFQVISLSRFLSFLNFLPSKTPSYLSTKDNGSVGASSQRSDYEVALNNKTFLEDYLKNMSFREKAAKELNVKFFKKTVFTLTSESNLQHKYAYFDGVKTTKFAYQYATTDDILVVFIYLPDEELKKPTASQLFGRAVIYILTPRDEKVIEPLLQNNDIDTLFSVGYVGNTKDQVKPVQEVKTAK